MALLAVQLDPHQRTTRERRDGTRWRADGQKLFFVGDQGMMAAPITANTEAPFGRPQLLFRVQGEQANWSGKNQYVPSADGKRFLINLPEGGASSPIVVVIQLAGCHAALMAEGRLNPSRHTCGR